MKKFLLLFLTLTCAAVAQVKIDQADVDGLPAALNAKAPLASPALTGTPTAPTAAAGTNTTQLATTAFVEDRARSGTVARASAAALISDGVTASARAYIALGAPGNIGAGDFTDILRIQMPASIARNMGIAWVGNTGSSAFPSAGGVAFTVRGAATNSLIIQSVSASGGYRQQSATVAQYLGKTVVFAWGRRGGVPFINIDGDDLVLAAETTGGSGVPSWTDSTTTHYGIGNATSVSTDMWPGEITPLRTLINSGLSTAQLSAFVQAMKLEQWGEVGVGNVTNDLGTTWSNNPNPSFDFDTLTGATPTGFSATISTGIGYAFSPRAGANLLEAGSRIRWRGTFTKNAGSGTVLLQVIQDNATMQIALSASGSFDQVFTLTSRKSAATAYVVTVTGAAGLDFTLADMKIETIGPTARLAIQPGGPLGGVLRDAGANGLTAVYTAGMLPITTDNRGTVRGRLTWSGSHEPKALLADQALIPANALIDSITVVSDAATTGAGIAVSDGDTVGYWSAAATHAAGTKVYRTIANRYPATAGAADLKIYVDPDSANFTGNVDVTVNYVLTY